MRITLNVASRNEYVPEVERYISTIKERARARMGHMKLKTATRSIQAQMRAIQKLVMNLQMTHMKSELL